MNRQMARDMDLIIKARSNAKSARREAAKAKKEADQLAKQIQGLLQKGQMDQATKKARLLLAKEAQANRLEETADAADLIALQINMNSKETMAQRVLQDGTRIMQSAQKHSNLEKSLATAEQYKEQVEEFKLRNDFYQEAVADSTSTQVNNDAVQDLISKLADGVGLDLKQELDTANPSRAEPVKETNQPTAEAEDMLKERLRALRA